MRVYEEVNEAVFGFLPFKDYTRDLLSHFDFENGIPNIESFYWSILGFLMAAAVHQCLCSGNLRMYSSVLKRNKSTSAYLVRVALNEIYGFMYAMCSSVMLISLVRFFLTGPNQNKNYVDTAFDVFEAIFLVIVSIIVLMAYLFAVLVSLSSVLGLAIDRVLPGNIMYGTEKLDIDFYKTLEKKHSALTDEWSNYFEDMSDPRLSSLLEASAKAEDAKELLKQNPKDVDLASRYEKAIDAVEIEFIKTEVEDD